MATVIDRSGTERQTKIIGRAWRNEVKEGENAGTKYLAVKLNRGITLTLNDTDRLTLWPNQKRTGINPRTGNEYVDADFNLGVTQYVD